MSDINSMDGDNTNRPARQKSLQEQFNLFSTVVAHLPINLFGFDRDGMITFTGGSVFSDLDIPTRQTVGLSIFDLYQHDTQFVDDARNVLKDGRTRRRERPFLDYVFDTYLIPFFDAEHQVEGVIGVGINITEQKLLEAALLEHERLRIALEKEHELSVIKDEIMGRVSHEFRNPLAVIQMSADMLERHGDKMDEAGRARRFEQIHSQITHLSRILDDLTFSVKHSSGYPLLNVHYDVFDIRLVCAEVLEELSSRFGVEHETRLEIASGISTVAAAPQIVHTVLLQLLSNAYKYSDPGSTVTLQVDIEAAVTSGQDTSPPEIVIRVSDQGIGIPETDREHLFEAFYRGSNFDERPGLGLGLSIAREAVYMHEGSLTYDTVLDQGTTFTVRLPMATHLLANGVPNGSSA